MKKTKVILDGSESYAAATSTNQEPIIYVKLDMILKVLEVAVIFHPDLHGLISSLKDQKTVMTKIFYKDRENNDYRRYRR